MDIAFEPYKKLSFRSYMIHDSPEALARAVTGSMPAGVPVQGSINWANGVLFRFFAYRPADSVVKEYIAGHLLWDHIDIAPMPKYQNVIMLPERPMVIINVLDVSKHALFGPVSDWLRDNLLRKKSVLVKPHLAPDG